MSKTRYPFEAPYSEIESNVDSFIDAIFETLQSSFLFMPRGPGFVTYQDFQDAYEVLKRHTGGFGKVDAKNVWTAFEENGLVFVILRTMLGFSPPELAYVATETSQDSVSQSFARNLDRRVRIEREVAQSLSTRAKKRVAALIATACQLLKEGVQEVPEEMIHRLEKADTRSGLSSLRHVATEDIPYPMLLYERFLGRPFASHRDSVSELVGEVMENAVEERLRKAGVSFRKTKREIK